MSSLLVLQDKNNIIMTSDTASSIVEDGKTYRVSDNVPKIFNIGKYKMFASGQEHLRDYFLSIAEKEADFTPIIAEKILKKYFNVFDEFSLEVVIGESIENGTRLHFLSSYEGFNIRENTCFTDDVMLFAAGIKTNGISNSFEYELGKSSDVFNSIVKAYEANQSEEVGGSIEIHQLLTDNVKRVELSRIELNRKNTLESAHLIVGDVIIGRLLIGSRLLIEDVDGIIKISGSTMTVYDNLGKEQVVIGKYDTDKYGIKINNGSIEIVGGLTRDNISKSYTDSILYDDSKIRGELRLTSPLPNSITLNADGITAYTPSTTNFARMDYRGLYVQGGAVDIRTSTQLNRGVTLDGNGLRGYKSDGTESIRIDTTGNAVFAGNLSAAGGTFSGNLSAVGGTFSGNLSAAGGTFSGSLSAASGTFGGTLSSVNGTFSGSLSGATGTFSGELRAATGTFNGLYSGTISSNQINTTTLSAISADLGNIRSGNIDITESASIGAGLTLKGAGRTTGIYFGRTQIMQTDDGQLNIGSSVSIGSFTEFHGQVNFSRATVIGLGGSSNGTTVRYSASSNRLYVDLNGVQQGYVNVI